MALSSALRCSRRAFSSDRFTHHPAAPNKTAAMIGQTQSCRRKNRPVACSDDALRNRREIATVRVTLGWEASFMECSSSFPMIGVGLYADRLLIEVQDGLPQVVGHGGQGP